MRGLDTLQLLYFNWTSILSPEAQEKVLSGKTLAEATEKAYNIRVGQHLCHRETGEEVEIRDILIRKDGAFLDVYLKVRRGQDGKDYGLSSHRLKQFDRM